jgi:hypothetical protein
MPILKNYLRKVDDKFIHTGELLEAYIPMSFFEGNISKFIGSEIETVGLFYVREFVKGKPVMLELVNLPSTLTLFPAATRDEHIRITGYEKDDSYKVLSFYKDTPFMYSYITQNSDNIQLYLDLILAGKINHIPYGDMLSIWEKNLNMNKVNLGVPASSMEIIIGEMYTMSDNPDITYGVAKNKNPKLNELDYRSRNIREICSRSSTFAALTFEDFDTMLASSLDMNKSSKAQQISPLEASIKY